MVDKTRSARASLDAQRDHWERTYRELPDKFGHDPSEAGRRAERVFAEHGSRDILELGCGGGRDALYFASHAYEVDALDYASSAIGELQSRARFAALDARLRAHVHDARTTLPFHANRFDAVFGHMFHNMALDDDELDAIFDETYRVLRPRGLLVFSARNTSDPDANEGFALAPFLRDVDGDVIRFFSAACLASFVRRYEPMETIELCEGSLPKRLSLAVVRKPAHP